MLFGGDAFRCRNPVELRVTQQARARHGVTAYVSIG